ncbi:MAG: zinc ribbon domain-containing protein [Clostridiales bacterium]|nr:zinc ribbon domain-containing protein [Clostridiales bacterium]
MTKKETVVSVILGVAIVSLITSVIAVAVDSFAMLIDYNGVSGKSGYAYPYVIGGLELFFAIMVVSFSAISLALKGKTRDILIIVLGIVTLLFFMISIIVLRLNVDSEYYNGEHYISTKDYTLFSSYLTLSVTLTISVIATVVSYFILTRSKAAQAPAATENVTTINVAQHTPGNVAPAPEQKVETGADVKAKPEKAVQGGYFCSNCGKKNTETAQFCSNCGKKLK